MAAASLDAGAFQQLLSMGQQYATVEQQLRTLAEELKNTKQRRRQLAAEVKFLQAKLRSFQRLPELDGPSQAAHDLKSVEAPQFYEVEVKFADSFDAGVMDSMAFQYPSSLRDPQIEFAPNAFSRQEMFLAR